MKIPLFNIELVPICVIALFHFFDLLKGWESLALFSAILVTGYLVIDCFVGLIRQISKGINLPILTL